jgi:CelD/BcsL family acetyltransferase involved in cellulose biosynthesis
MVVAKLSLDGRPAAFEAGFRHAGTFYLYLRAFAPELAAFGPGNVLTEQMLRWCAENGIERYDMLAPRSRNKREWQSGEVAVVDFALPMSAGGRLYTQAGIKRIGPALRTSFYALPAPLRSALAGLTLRS